MSADQSL